MSPRSASLAALCALLMALIVLELSQGESQHAPKAPQVPNAQALAGQGQPWRAAPLQQYSEIVERSLFEPSRRRQGAEPEAAPVASAELRDLTLLGVMITPRLRIAFLRDSVPEQVIRLEAGASHGKWRLVEIDGEGVTLRSGGATRRLPLHPSEERFAQVPDSAAAPSTAPASRPARRRQLPSG